MPPRRLQQLGGALDVHPLIKGRLRQAGPDSGARGQMDDLVEMHPGQQFPQTGGVGHVAAAEGERLAQGLKIPEIALFDGDIVERVQVIQYANSMSGMEQPLAKMRADKPGAACDQEIHLSNDLGIMTQQGGCGKPGINVRSRLV